MSEDLTGLGDNDISEINRKRHEELRDRNPDNEPEVTLSKWTLARLTRGGQFARSVVYGVVTNCLTDDYRVGDIACSSSLVSTPPHPGRRIFVSQNLRFECQGAGNEITIPEEELNSRVPGPDESIDDIKRRLESGQL
jgi:hypothetical protein